MTIDRAAEQAFQDKHKETHGGWASIVWIGAGNCLFLTTPGASLWKSVLFIAVGMFLAAAILGGFAYLVQRMIVGVLVKIAEPSPRVMVVVNCLLALLAFDTALTVIVARYVFHQVVR